MTEKLERILEIDNEIRFVSLISNEGVFLDYLFRKDLKQVISTEKQKKMGGRVSLAGDIHKTMDKHIGKSLFTLTHREKYDTLLTYINEKILLVSLEPDGNHEQIIREIIKQSESLNI